MDTNHTATLAAKLARILGAVKRLEKNGKNDRFNYKFASDPDVLDAIRPLLAEHNVMLVSSLVDITRETRATEKSVTYNALVTVKYTYICGDTGATIEAISIGEANDTQDKAVNKALTACMKYHLLKMFLISTGDPADDPDADHRNRQRQNQNARRQQSGQPAGQGQTRPATTPTSSTPVTNDPTSKPWYSDGVNVAHVRASTGDYPSIVVKKLNKALTDFATADDLIKAYRQYTGEDQTVPEHVPAQGGSDPLNAYFPRSAGTGR